MTHSFSIRDKGFEAPYFNSVQGDSIQKLQHRYNCNERILKIASTCFKSLALIVFLTSLSYLTLNYLGKHSLSFLPKHDILTALKAIEIFAGTIVLLSAALIVAKKKTKKELSDYLTPEIYLNEILNQSLEEEANKIIQKMPQKAFNQLIRHICETKQFEEKLLSILAKHPIKLADALMYGSPYFWSQIQPQIDQSDEACLLFFNRIESNLSTIEKTYTSQSVFSFYRAFVCTFGLQDRSNLNFSALLIGKTLKNGAFFKEADRLIETFTNNVSFIANASDRPKLKNRARELMRHKQNH